MAMNGVVREALGLASRAEVTPTPPACGSLASLQKIEDEAA